MLFPASFLISCKSLVLCAHKSDVFSVAAGLRAEISSTFITFRWDRASIGINNPSRAIFGHIVNRPRRTTHGRIVIGPMAYFLALKCAFFGQREFHQVVDFFARSSPGLTKSTETGEDDSCTRHDLFLSRPIFWSELLHWWPHHNWICFIFASPSLSSFILCNQRCQVMLNYAPDCHSTNRLPSYCMKLMPMCR